MAIFGIAQNSQLYFFMMVLKAAGLLGEAAAVFIIPQLPQGPVPNIIVLTA